MKTSFDLLTGRDDNQLIEFEDQRLEKDTLKAFIKLRDAAKREADIDLAIVSSFRGFDRQKLIWNKKVCGERKVYDDFEDEVDLSNLSPIQIVNAITRFSAIPGASRHHWGTDIDIFDRAACDKSAVQLQPSEYSETGIFAKLNSWLNDRIKAKDCFGFYKPFKTDLGGIHPEAWHLSFAPKSLDFQTDYTIEIFKQNLIQSDFKLNDVILENASELFDKLFIRLNQPPQM